LGITTEILGVECIPNKNRQKQAQAQKLKQKKYVTR